MHKSFRPNIIILDKPPFCVRRIGWGFFDIKIIVHWKKIMKQKDLLILEHELNFNGCGEEKKIILKILKDEKL